ncbi:pseudouridylate synthase RPUSD4, mitochondrial isoform X2 [Lampris incognitus]|uniref:pseudouridylate synthase RPUSD4, mitochondrial isoform X2 n=1 Tax=Lampris incognitus TaxID=2546036 RepID=UPI0024B6262F|nr:pseudouridylate synthase RPUSD4, mitochondrial isoform X2 [Lampris incognitus]
MNRCKTVAVLCVSDWTYVRNITFLRSRTAKCRRASLKETSFLSRSHATATTQCPELDADREAQPRAIDLARKIQQAKINAKEPDRPLSAQEKAVRELKQLSQQLQGVHPNVLAKYLHNSVLFQNQDVVVINKPYGIPVRGSPGITSISSVLPVLTKMMEGMRSVSQLYPCPGLEKEMTGILVLAKREEVVDHIVTLHKNNQVRKKMAITVGVPVPSEGVIDIPVIEKEVSGPRPHYKMALSPVYRMDNSEQGVTRVRAHRQAHGAVTTYRVLDSSGGCSLVELHPLSGVKHQIRVHMAGALACPILGDHKYSQWSKLAPQKLPEGVLRKLGLEQSKTRHLPLYLHARQLTIPGSNHQPDICVSCPLPRYFFKTLQRLQLTLPPKEENQ